MTLLKTTASWASWRVMSLSNSCFWSVQFSVRRAFSESFRSIAWLCAQVAQAWAGVTCSHNQGDQPRASFFLDSVCYPVSSNRHPASVERGCSMCPVFTGNIIAH